MTFEMNNRKWEIIEKSQKEMKQSVKEHGDAPDDGRYFGLTYMDDQKIFIDKDICQEQKKQTLMHELMHCYIQCYVSNTISNFDEEMVCNISSNSHDIIHKIVEDYFKEVKQ